MEASLPAILPNSGRIALAGSLKSQRFHIAWGVGEDWWDMPHNAFVALDIAGRAKLPHAPVLSVEVRSSDGTYLYASGSDYTVSTLTGEIVRVPTGTIPAGATLDVSYIAGRRVLEGFETGLIAEVGRRLANSVAFVAENANGEIELPSGTRYSISETPTRSLYVSANFAFSDASDATIREVAIILNTVPVAGVSPEKPYLLPAEVADSGTLLLIDRPKPILRSAATASQLAYVITL